MESKSVIFTGGGCNDSSWRRAINNAAQHPSKHTIPAGATWPFVKLSINRQSVSFTMANIRKSVTPSDVVVSLSKWGYIYFHSDNGANDFGFTTPKAEAVLQELRGYGYRLDKSCERNLRIAKAVLYSATVVEVALVVIVTTLAILKPHGI